MSSRALPLPPLFPPPPPPAHAQPLNRIVVWDRIIQSPDEARLLARGNFSKYPILDQKTELRGRVVNLTLHWDVMPYTGVLIAGSGGSFSARLPDAYCEGASAGACAFAEVLDDGAAAAATEA